MTGKYLPTLGIISSKDCYKGDVTEQSARCSTVGQLDFCCRYLAVPSRKPASTATRAALVAIIATDDSAGFELRSIVFVPSSLGKQSDHETSV